MHWRLVGWPADIARSVIVLLIWFAGMYIGFGMAFGGLGWLGFVLWFIAFLLGPFGAARVACRLVPTDRKLVVRLGLGTLCGLFLFLVGLGVFFKHAEPLSREKDGRIYILIPVAVAMPWLGALAFSRWKAPELG